MTAMKTDNNPPTKNPSQQVEDPTENATASGLFVTSVSIGVITLILVSVFYYFGIFRL